MPLVLGVDSSTQATKVEARDADTGALVGTGRAPHPAVQPPRAEQDPRAWWHALEAARAQAGHERDVVAIAVAAQQHGLVAVDARGEVIRAAKLWNDTESAPDAAWLLPQLDGGRAAWAEACGSVPVASFTITKLSWLHRQEPENFARLAHVLLPHDWLTFRLTGRFVTDRGDASGTGYWSPAEGRWRTDLLEIVDRDTDWPAALPEVLGPTHGVAENDGAVIGPGTGDNMAAALGIGLAPGDVAISLGTSGIVCTVREKPTADSSGTLAGFADATGRFLPLVCTLNATKVSDAVARLLGVDHAGLDGLALAATPGAGGLVLVPYLDGERTPDRPDATGMLTGIRSDVTREQLARAAYEGVLCGLLDGLDALEPRMDANARLVLVGGGARSGAYPRLLADLTGRAVLVPDDTEQVAIGACVQAAAVHHGRPPEEVARAWCVGRGRVVAPAGAVDRGAIRATYAAAVAAAGPGDRTQPAQ